MFGSYHFKTQIIQQTRAFTIFNMQMIPTKVLTHICTCLRFVFVFVTRDSKYSALKPTVKCACAMLFLIIEKTSEDAMKRCILTDQFESPTQEKYL